MSLPLSVMEPSSTKDMKSNEASTSSGEKTEIRFPHNVEFIQVSAATSVCIIIVLTVFLLTYTSLSLSFSLPILQGNYVPPSDSALGNVTPEYDVILGLSLTKWIHLNWGDEGIKRFFRKVYLHLRPGGKFIVEPQPFASYTKKKKVTVS